MKLRMMFVLLVMSSAITAAETNEAVTFKEKYGESWQIDWNDKTNTPRSIYGYNAELNTEAPLGALAAENGLENSLKSFIAANKDILKVDESELRLSSLESDPPGPDRKAGVSYAFFGQFYKGIPVYGGGIGITVIDNKIVSISSGIYPGISISTTPEISEKNALENTGEKLKIVAKPSNVSLVIFPWEPDGSNYRLAYKVDLPFSSDASGAWDIFVDANTGEILYEYNKVIYDRIAGTVRGSIYPEYPSQEQQNKTFKNNNVTLRRAMSRIFYSGMGNSISNTMQTADKVDLSGASAANISFLMRYDTEASWDFAYVQASTNGADWSTLATYDGSQSSWKSGNASLAAYLGQQIYIRFNYTTDSSVVKEGFYVDNITVMTNSGIAFSDDAEDGSGKWALSGFMISGEYNETASNITDENGYYEIYGDLEGKELYSELKGPYVSVVNDNRTRANYAFSAVAGARDWNWSVMDSSDRQEESNVFYHINKVHDFFTRGSPFDIIAMDYQLIATVQSSVVQMYYDGCNAFYDGSMDLYFGGGDMPNCENLALGSDVIYHEYTHAVVDRIYTVPFPYQKQTGAMNEGWADYFAVTINNNSKQGEGIFINAYEYLVRNLNNTLRFPDDFRGGVNCVPYGGNDYCYVHDNSRIFSGAMWDLRSALGSDITDSMIIRTMKMQPMSFSEFLNDLLVIDDDNGNLEDGTLHQDQICDSFYTRHGITSYYCFTFETSGSVPYLYSNSSNVAIPDNGGWGSSLLSVSEKGVIKKVLVYAGINHTFIGDLIVNIVSPSGKTITLHNRTGGGTDNIYAWYDNETFSDGVESLDALINSTSNGTWILNVTDKEAADTGFIDEFRLKLFLSDATPPDMEFAQPTDGDNALLGRNFTIVNASITDSFSGVDACVLEWDGANETMEKTGTANNAVCFTNKTDSDGTHSYIVYANDSSGNNAYLPRTITFDTTPPRASIAFSPSNGFSPNSDGLRDDIEFNITASETVNFSTTYIIGADGNRMKTLNKVDGTNSIKKSWNGCYVQSCSSGIVPDGLYSIEIKMTDMAGNVNATNLTEKIIVDTVPINLTFAYPTPNNETLNANNTITINILASETPAFLNLEWNGTNETVTVPLVKMNLDDGNYSFRLYANDSGGNWNVSETRWVVINATRNMTAAISMLNQAIAANSVTMFVLNSSSEVADTGRLLSFERYTLRFNISNVLVDAADFLAGNLNASSPPNFTSNLTAEANISSAFNNSGGIVDSYIWIDLNSLLPSGNFTAKIVFPRIYAVFFYMNGTKEAPDITRITNACNENASNMPCYNISYNSSTLYLPSFSGGAAGNDTTAPSLIISSPASTTYVSPSIPLSYTAGDNVALDRCWYSLNGVNSNLSNCGNAIITAAAGTNTIYVYANDTSNNTNRSIVTFAYTPPAPPSRYTGGGSGDAVIVQAKENATVNESKSAPAPEKKETRIQTAVTETQEQTDYDTEETSETPAVTGLVTASPTSIDAIVIAIGILTAIGVAIWEFRYRSENYAHSHKKSGRKRRHRKRWI